MTCMIFFLLLVTSTSVAMEAFFYKAICSLFIFYSVITWRAQYSRALSSAITPSYKRWSASYGSTARFNPTPFKALIVGFSASFFVVNAPSAITSAPEAFVCSISVAFDVPIAKLVTPYQLVMCGSITPAVYSGFPLGGSVATFQIFVGPPQWNLWLCHW